MAAPVERSFDARDAADTLAYLARLWARDAAAIPLIATLLGASWGAGGVILVQASASLLVGTVAVLAAWRYVTRLPIAPAADTAPTIPQPAYSTGRAALAAQLVGEESPPPLAERDISR